MDPNELYEADFLLWTEQQAAALRQLAGHSNSLDIANLAEEVESSGRRELRGVESTLEQILLHLLKIASDPSSPEVPHWRSEIVGFQGNAQDDATPSMAQRIQIDRLWRKALRTFAAGRTGTRLTADRLDAIGSSPLSIAAILDVDFDLETAVAAVDAVVIRLGDEH